MSEDNIIEIAQEAQKRGKFSLADAVKGRNYPEKSVDIYIDGAAAFELDEVNKELQYLADTGRMEEYDKLNEKAQEIKQRIIDSKLTFHMRGIGQSKVEAITEECNKLYPAVEGEPENPNWIKHYLSALIAENIVKVTDAEGNEDAKKFTTEEIIELRGAIPIDGWEALIDTMQKLTLATSYFDAITDAGFLPKS